MKNNRPIRLFSTALLACTAAIAGCASSPDGGASGATAEQIRTLPMFAGDSGARLGWADLSERIAAADVIIVGEQHDDAMGHALQLAIVREAFTGRPGGVLSLEMLDRDTQPVVDDYDEGVVTQKQFAKLSRAGAWMRWDDWYQPIVDAALEADARIVAANAPRRYVRLARKEGYERIEVLGPTRRGWVELPRSTSYAEYEERFRDVMSDVHSEESGNDDMLESIYRSQLVWDATMADSIARARAAGATKVVHLVGRFHVDFGGGTVQELRTRAPDARVLVVSMSHERAEAMRDDDRGRADVVVYTAR
jgi:uncharacterized iron-regulated protein